MKISWKNKRLVIFSVSALTSATMVSVPCITIVSNSANNSHIIEKKEEKHETNTLYDYPSGLTYNDLYKQFNYSEDGFVEVFAILAKINPALKIDGAQLRDFFHKNKVKAFEFIDEANSHVFTQNVIGEMIYVSEDGKYWHTDRVLDVVNGKIICSYSGSWSSSGVKWDDNGYYGFSSRAIAYAPGDGPHNGIVKYMLIQN